MLIGTTLVLSLGSITPQVAVDPDVSIYETIKGLGFKEATATTRAEVPTTGSVQDYENYKTMLTHAKSFFASGTAAPNVEPLKTYYDNVNAWLFLVTFITELNSNGSDPKNLNDNVVNADAYKTLAYLANYPSTTNNVFEKIKGYFDSNDKPKTEIALDSLKTLLSNTNLQNFLDTDQKNKISQWLSNTSMYLAQATEKDRVNAAISGIGTVTNTNFADSFGKIKELATSVTQNIATDPNLSTVYTELQTAFCGKLTELHNERPRSDLTTLTALSTFYSQLSNHPLSSTSCYLTDKISDIGSDSIQLEMNRITALLGDGTGNFGSKTSYADKFEFLKNLAKGVSDANFGFDYTPAAKTSFETALNSLHAARTEIAKDKSKLEELKAWYETLKSPLTKLLTSDATLNAKITELESDINLASKAIQDTGETTTVQDTGVVTTDINATIVSHINSILKGTSIKIGTKTYVTKVFKDKVTALKALATTYKKASGIAPATQDAFAAAIMKVGGDYIYKNVKNINALYAKVKTKNKTEKNKIKKFIKTSKKSLDDFGKYKSMLSAAYNSNLLGGTKTTGHKAFVYKVLILYTNRLIALGKVK